MRFAVLTHSLPQPNSNGGPMTVWAIVEELIRAGYEVVVIALVYPDDPFAAPDRQAKVIAAGARLHLLTVSPSASRNLGQRIRGSLDFSRTLATRSVTTDIIALLERERAEAVLLYHWDCVAALHGWRGIPKLGAVGDPWHLPALRSWQHARPQPWSLNYWKRTLAVSASRWLQPRAMARLLKDCDACGTFQYAETEVFRRMGVANCAYYRTAVSDPARAHAPPHATVQPKTILLGPSNLEATSTRHGLMLFATEILPVLERELGPDGFCVRVVGEGKPPPELARLLPRSNIVLTGRIEPPDDEFRTCAVQLVPTPFVLGIRVRIVTGMAFGCCIVAHRSEAANIPELADGLNCFLADTGAALAKKIVAAIRQPALREEIGRNARRDYESQFAPSVAVKPVRQTLEELVNNRQSAAPCLPTEGGFGYRASE